MLRAKTEIRTRSNSDARNHSRQSSVLRAMHRKRLEEKARNKSREHHSTAAYDSLDELDGDFIVQSKVSIQSTKKILGQL